MLGAGDVVGKFKLVRPLGDGATARVWLAHSVKDRADEVAVKLIRPTQVEGNVERFAREADLLWRLDHPHIVRLRTSGALLEQGLLYLVMDFVDGEPLDARLARGPMSPDAVRTLFAGLGDALRYAHGRGTFHRDLKPHNVMVRPDGAAVLIDFGIALDAQRGRPSLTGDGLVAGTVAYMAPEVFRAGVRPDPALGDVYAMGLMLYEALTGRRAFPVPAGLNEQQAVARVIADKGRYDALDPGEHAPADLRALVKLATEPHPELRLASMARMAERLGAPPVSGSAARPAARADALGGDSGTRWLDEDDDPFGEPSESPASEKGSGWRPPGVGASNASGRAPARVEPPPPPPVSSLLASGEISVRADRGAVAPSSAPPPRLRTEVPPAPTSRAAVPPVAPPAASAGPVRPAHARTSSGAPRGAEAVLGGVGGSGGATTSAERGFASVGDAGSRGAPEAASAPAPAGTDPAPAGPTGPSTWWMLVAAAAVAALVLVVLAGGVLFWVLSSPAAPIDAALPPASGATVREVSFAVPPGVRLGVDGVEVPVVAGRAAGAWSEGPHTVWAAIGEGCAGASPVPGACCAVASAVVLVEAGSGALALEAPAVVPPGRDLEVSVAAPDRPDARPAVRVDGQELGRAGDVWLALGLAVGEHVVRVDVGACGEADAGCAGELPAGEGTTSTCPAGCASWSTPVTVTCGEGRQPLAVSLPAPAVAPETPVAPADEGDVGVSGAKASATPRPPRPTKEPVLQEAPKEAPRPITVRIAATGISVDKALEGALIQASVQRQETVLETCYRGWLRGSAALPKAVTVSFKVDKSGAVDQASVRTVSSSGETALDTCAIGAVRRANMSGTKKAAEGRVKIQFESYQ